MGNRVLSGMVIRSLGVFEVEQRIIAFIPEGVMIASPGGSTMVKRQSDIFAVFGVDRNGVAVEPF